MSADADCGMTEDNLPVQGRDEGPEVGTEATGGSSAGGRSYPAAGACVGACADAQLSGCAPDGEEAVLRRTIPLRQQLRSLVLAGKVTAAIELTESLYPGLLSRSVALHFRLRCQSFIELIRAARPTAALAYAQAELALYQTTPSVAVPSGASAGAGSKCTEVAGLDLREQLEEVISLLAYDDLSSAPASSARLLQDEYREATADLLNGSILEAHGIKPSCAIERLLRHLIATTDAIREANQGYGELVSVALEAASSSKLHPRGIARDPPA